MRAFPTGYRLPATGYRLLAEHPTRTSGQPVRRVAGRSTRSVGEDASDAVAVAVGHARTVAAHWPIVPHPTTTAPCAVTRRGGSPTTARGLAVSEEVVGGLIYRAVTSRG